MGRGAAKLENPWAAPAPAPTLVDDAVVKEAEPEFRRVNLACKWRDRVIELPGLDESLTVEDVKIIIEEETGVPAERVKLVGLKARVGRVNDDMRLADLVLKLPTQKVIVMGTPDEELLREPSSPVEIFDDLSDRPVQITKYTAWEWARCSRGELDGFNEDSGKPWKCVFVDTFLSDGPPDPTKWSFQTDCNAWVHDQNHRERQLYTDKENAHVKDGVLYIEARRDEPTPDLPYTSARLTTRDAAHGRWRYGRVEVCAKLPPGKPGLWPAIWMMPSRSVYGKWPLSGEIDLMENVGWEPGVVRASIHTAKNHRRRGNHNRRVSGVKDAHAAFHVYACDWTPDRVEFFVDDRKFYSYKNEGRGAEQWPFDQDFHLILNVAVGGAWAARRGIDDSAFPCAMEVAFVKVFQRRG